MPSDGDDQPFDKRSLLRRLGAQIAKVRARKGYSQDRLYLEAGLARGTMSKIENGLVRRLTDLPAKSES